MTIPKFNNFKELSSFIQENGYLASFLKAFDEETKNKYFLSPCEKSEKKILQETKENILRWWNDVNENDFKLSDLLYFPYPNLIIQAIKQDYNEKHKQLKN